jgi:hypothetical protein
MTRVTLPGMALQVLPSSVALLQPEESAFEAIAMWVVVAGVQHGPAGE